MRLAQPLTLAETKGFIGERFDDGSGLQYLNARYYDPRLGMFLQPDWWEVTGPGVGTNRYSYSFNDPVNGRDPGGHVAESPWDLLNIALGGVSLYNNVSSGNLGGALADVVGLAYDISATAAPGVPGGGAAAILTTRILRAGPALTARANRLAEISEAPGLHQNIAQSLKRAAAQIEGSVAQTDLSAVSGMLKETLGIPLGKAKPDGALYDHIRKYQQGLDGLAGPNGAISRLESVLARALKYGDLTAAQRREVEKARKAARAQADRLQRLKDAAEKAKEAIDKVKGN